MSDYQQTTEGKTSKQIIGRLGEDAVARRYQEEGYVIVARNVRESRNEIDLIAADKEHLVFVEVKTRHARPGARSRYGRPADSIDKAKKARTVAAAEAFLREHRHEFQGLYPRIDVAEVYMTLRADGSQDITDVLIFRNAFGAR